MVIAFKDGPDLKIRKQQLYNIFPLKDHGTLYYYDGSLERKINYYIENVVLARKANYVYTIVNLLCPSSYFMDSEHLVNINSVYELIFILTTPSILMIIFPLFILF